MKHCTLKEAREDSGRPAREISEALDLSRSQLYRVEAGECQASFELARRIRNYWPPSKVPDMAIYDPIEFERRRRNANRRVSA